MRKGANSIDNISCAGSVTLIYSFAISRGTKPGSRLLDPGADAGIPEDLSAQCHIDKAGGSNKGALTSIGQRNRRLKQRTNVMVALEKCHWSRGNDFVRRQASLMLPDLLGSKGFLNGTLGALIW